MCVCNPCVRTPFCGGPGCEGPPPPPRRERRLVLSDFFFLNLLGPREPDPYRVVVVEDAIPPDAEIRGVAHDSFRQELVLLLHSESFSPVEPGSEIPFLQPVYRCETPAPG